MKINESTAAVTSVLAVLVGGIFFITSMYAQTNENTNSNKEIKLEIVEIKKDANSFQNEVLQRLVRIEENTKRKRD
jgi:uncharacterized protein YycO